MIIISIVVLTVSLITAAKFDSIAEMKGHSGYFWWCFWLGPAGWAMVIALPDRKKDSDLSAGQKQNISHNSVTDDSLPEL